ncbi:MAG: twin-arginine translocation signal domain-containing protein, partial [Armatimonadota bacterium]
MRNRVARRQFLASSAAAAAGLALGLEHEACAQPPFKHKLHKALIVGKPTEESLAPMKEAGFDGVEARIVSPEEAAQAKQVADGLGMRIHSVLRGWASFNSNNEDEVSKSVDTTAAALRAGQAYGADAVLLVPCRIGGQAMPEPWEFRIRFDE